MELFPDLGLRISPPNITTYSSSSSSSKWRRIREEEMDPLGFWKRGRNSNSNPNPQQQQQQQGGQDLNLRLLRGIPVYQSQNSPFFPFAASATATDVNHSQSLSCSRFPLKRSIRGRAPRMRWSTTLHARFVHAVHLLGGHQRATPKSVLELMDVKDLTLAHVKSHLQMYRTVKSTDKASANSGHSDTLDNGVSGDTSDDFVFSLHKSEVSVEKGAQINVEQENEYSVLWSNSSSGEAWLHDSESPREKEMEGYDLSSSETSCPKKKPNLEFTLGRE